MSWTRPLIVGRDIWYWRGSFFRTREGYERARKESPGSLAERGWVVTGFASGSIRP